MDIKDIKKLQQGVNTQDNQIDRIKIGAVVLFMVAIALIAINFGGLTADATQHLPHLWGAIWR